MHDNVLWFTIKLIEQVMALNLDHLLSHVRMRVVLAGQVLKFVLLH